MASIPYAVFLVVGIVVTVISSFKQELFFFRYIGIVLVVYGTGKLVFKYITERALKESEPVEIQTVGRELRMRQAPQELAKGIQTTRCLRCGAIVSINHNFCNSCGLRLR